MKNNLIIDYIAVRSTFFFPVLFVHFLLVFVSPLLVLSAPVLQETVVVLFRLARVSLALFFLVLLVLFVFFQLPAFLLLVFVPLVIFLTYDQRKYNVFHGDFHHPTKRMLK